jgi:amino acid transporter
LSTIETAFAASGSATRPNVRKLTTLPLIAAIFFMVSGGPFGLEEVVGNAGYAMSMLAFVIIPLIWSFPTALMVGELSSAIPRDGGYYVWVTRALGPFWGFLEAWLSLSSSIFDMALYPTVFVLYAGQVFPVLQNNHTSVAVGAALIIICTVWNLRGARLVGNSAIVLGVILFAPFLLMSVKAYASPALWHTTASSGSGTLLTALLVVMWNFMGWDNASTIAAEVENPQKTYGRAMLSSALLVAVAYLIPVGACWRAGISSAGWSTGAWAEAARQIAGPVVFYGVVLAGMIFGVGMFNSLALSYTRVPYAMAEDGWLPKVLTRKNRFDVPWVSVLACAGGWVLALTLGFVKLIELDVVIYGLSLFLEFVALVALRIKEPGLPRSFRIPGGLPGCILVSIGPTTLIALAVFESAHETTTIWGWTFNNLAVGLTVVALGPIQFWLANRKSRIDV